MKPTPIYQKLFISSCKKENITNYQEFKHFYITNYKFLQKKNSHIIVDFVILSFKGICEIFLFPFSTSKLVIL